MGDKVILSIDQSTAGTKAVLFNDRAEIVGKALINHKQHYPQPGWVEHDPDEIFTNLQLAAKQALETAGLSFDAVKCIAITNQRETALVWDKTTGKPVYNALVWQDGRAEQLMTELSAHIPYLREKTGLEPSPFFSAPKISWILRSLAGKETGNLAGASTKNFAEVSTKNLAGASTDNLAFGTIDSYVLHRLTGGRAHKTDVTNASRTLLLDLNACEWDDKALEIFGIPRSMCPEIVLCDAVNEVTAEGIMCGDEAIIPAGIPILSMIGDSHAALFGQCAFTPGSAKVTLGTGSSVMMNTGETPARSQNGLVSSVAYGVGGKVNYCLEGNINTTGGIIKWMVENLGILESSAQSGAIAASLEDNGGVYLIPALAGLAAPHWVSDARAAFVGMTLATTSAHLVRAGEEAIAYQITDVVRAMEKDTGNRLSALRADGGPTRDKFLMGFLASLAGCPVDAGGIEELSALGAAFIAGSVCGFYPGIDGIEALRPAGARHTASLSGEETDRYYAGWQAALKMIGI